jgi:hypothetical protein
MHNAKVPDYLADLNAMHEAEKVLTADQQVEYVERLECAIRSNAYECVDYWAQSNLCARDLNFRATATQRAEAFLRTSNLWKD